MSFSSFSSSLSSSFSLFPSTRSPLTGQVKVRQWEAARSRPTTTNALHNTLIALHNTLYSLHNTLFALLNTLIALLKILIALLKILIVLRNTLIALHNTLIALHCCYISLSSIALKWRGYTVMHCQEFYSASCWKNAFHRAVQFVASNCTEQRKRCAIESITFAVPQGRHSYKNTFLDRHWPDRSDKGLVTNKWYRTIMFMMHARNNEMRRAGAGQSRWKRGQMEGGKKGKVLALPSQGSILSPMGRHIHAPKPCTVPTLWCIALQSVGSRSGQRRPLGVDLKGASEEITIGGVRQAWDRCRGAMQRTRMRCYSSAEISHNAVTVGVVVGAIRNVCEGTKATVCRTFIRGSIIGGAAQRDQCNCNAWSGRA